MVTNWPKGANSKVIKQISEYKNEPQWMRDFRLSGLQAYNDAKLPKWGPNLKSLNVNKISLFKPAEVLAGNEWNKLPKGMAKKFDDLGIPKAESAILAGLETQFDSEAVFSSLTAELAQIGVIFCSLDQAVKQYPDIVQKYMSKVVPVNDNKFAALNSAAWSGGVFVYVPKGVRVQKPLHAFFLLNGKKLGQFERTLIIAEEGSRVDYIEGCTAPRFNVDTLHCAVVEVIAHKNAQVKYTTIQNWSKEVYNLVTKRAVAYDNAKIEWLDANFGSKVTMKYPSVILQGKKSSAEIMSLAVADSGQTIEAGNKAICLAPNTKANIQSKSIAKGNGLTSFRGWVSISKRARNSLINVKCDAMLLGKKSRTQTWPNLKNHSTSSKINHEAVLTRIESEQINYLASRGIEPQVANSLLVSGYIDSFKRRLPFDYAIELNRLVELEMKNVVG